MIRSVKACWPCTHSFHPIHQVSHARQLHTAGYRFSVLPDVFIIHADHGVPQWRGKGDLVKPNHTLPGLTCGQVRVRVWFNYYTFLGEIAFRYSTEPSEHSHRYAPLERNESYLFSNPHPVMKGKIGTNKVLACRQSWYSVWLFVMWSRHIGASSTWHSRAYDH